ncbi:unnamed protein product [Adineta steineri]|uniref:NHL repeat containing protein n=1 Tax=Adineta steineri TaxID=433720 RepID=A0A814V7W8_9BILA|nr:unnamed protein product [Adineta steineri]
MAMTSNKTQCFKCNKNKITYSCAGCSKEFCLMDLTEHRQILNNELNHITNEYKKFTQTINEQRQNPYNHSLIKQIDQWEEGQIIAGGNGKGNRMNKLSSPTTVIIDQQNHSIIIADRVNRRVIQWLDQNQQILIDNIDCYGLAMDKYKFLYVSGWKNNEVRRWKMEEYNNEGILVAGGNGKGNELDQLNSPGFLFVDEDQSVYISDRYNHRVMKWRKDAKEGTVVAGGNGKGENLNQLAVPQGVIVDDLGQIYVADYWNHRIMRWCEGKAEGEAVVGGNGQGNKLNQLNHPIGLSFDNEGNFYVVDCGNHRIEKFEIVL